MVYDNSAALDAVTAQAQERLQDLAEVRERLREQEGRGSSDSESVAATVGHDGRLQDLELNPRLLRSSSHEVAEQVLQAVNRAQDDLRSKVTEAMGPVLQGRPMEELFNPDSPAIHDLQRFGENLKAQFERVATEMAKMGRS